MQNIRTSMTSNEHNASPSKSIEINKNYAIMINHIKINIHQLKF